MQLTMLQLTLGGKWAWGGFRYVGHPPRGHRRAGLWASAAPTRPTTSSRVNIFHERASDSELSAAST